MVGQEDKGQSGREIDVSGERIRQMLETITNHSDCVGFEVYVIVSGSGDQSEQLKKMALQEEGDGNFRDKLKGSILEAIREKFLTEDIQYVPASRIADEQDKIYMIPTGSGYDPLSVLRQSSSLSFGNEDIVDTKGIAFRLRSGDSVVWAYQHIWSNLLPSRAKKPPFLARRISSNTKEYFIEISEPVMYIPKRVDMLMIGSCLITKDIKLLQNRFGFNDYIIASAEKTIQTISEKGIVEDIGKLKDYIKRGNGKNRYSKKMMRISDSKVLEMPADLLMSNIHRSSRWNGKIPEKDGKFQIHTFDQVEALIDLLDERYTRSEITGMEYDTSVKQLADKS